MANSLHVQSNTLLTFEILSLCTRKSVGQEPRESAAKQAGTPSERGTFLFAGLYMYIM